VPTYHVSPSGNAANPGTASQPWTLAHAATGAGGTLTSGDVVIIGGGAYQLGTAPGYTLTVTSACAGVTFRGVAFLPWQMPVLRGNLIVQAANSVWRDFRQTWDYDTARTTAQPGSSPTDIPRVVATFDPQAANVQAINVIAHDLGGGFNAFSLSPGFQAHECIAYNNGWNGPDRGHGHGFYMQSTATPNLPADRKTVRGLVSFCNYGSNGKLGGSDAVSNLIGFRYDGCSFFDPGVPVRAQHQPEPNFICDGASTRKGHIEMLNSSLWMRDGGYYDYNAADAPLSLWMGDNNEGANPLTIDDVRIQGRVRVGNWASATVTDNSVTAGDDALPWALGRALVQLSPTPSPYTKFTWDRNRYAHNGDARIMLPVSTMQNLASWRTTTGYDATGTHTVGEFTGVETQFVTSAVDPNRATVTVWNYDGAATIPLNVAPLLRPGDMYELYHVYDWVTTGTPTLSATYAGGTLSVPMSSKTPPTPQGGSALPALPNTFGVFVLLRTFTATPSRSMRLDESPLDWVPLDWYEPPTAPPQPAVTGLVRNRRRRLGGQR